MKNKYIQKELGFSINIDMKTLNRIYEYSKESYPNEIGGILIGSYSDDGLSASIAEMIIPKEFVSKRFLFIRYGKSLNKKIEELYRESNGEIIYIGEWHSHTNGSGLYSQTDLESMIDISEDKSIKVSSPILLISAITNNSFEPNFYICHNNKLHNYEKE